MHLQYPPPASLARLDDHQLTRLVLQSTSCALNEGELRAVIELVRMDGVPLEHALEEVCEECRRRLRLEKRPRTERAYRGEVVRSIEAARTGRATRSETTPASPPPRVAAIDPPECSAEDKPMLPPPAAREEDGPLALLVLDVPELGAQLLELLLCKDLGRLGSACARLATHAARDNTTTIWAVPLDGYARW